MTAIISLRGNPSRPLSPTPDQAIRARHARDFENCLTSSNFDVVEDACFGAIVSEAWTDEELPVLYTQRGRARLKHGDYATAIKDFDNVIRLNPRDAMAIFTRGICRLRAGDTAGANKDFASAVAITPKVEATLAILGIRREK